MSSKFTNEEILLLIGQIFFKKYQATKLIGIGSFGIVLEAIHINTKEHFAMKIEKKTQTSILETECKFLMTLQHEGIPKVLSFGVKNNLYVLVLELLGPTLYKLLNYLSLKDCCLISIQVLDRLEFIHSKFIIHRDIKPDNLTIGNLNKSLIYLIDFGTAKKYKIDKKHCKFYNIKRATGTPEFLSLNSNKGFTQSRRDDLESFGYLLIYLTKKNLPWCNLDKSLDIYERFSKILKMKSEISLEKLCEKLPNEFLEYMKYCRNLKFEEDPDYKYLRNLFKNVLIKNNFGFDMKFTWINENDYESHKAKILSISPTMRRKESPQNRIMRKIKGSIKKKNDDSENSTIEKSSMFNILIDQKAESFHIDAVKSAIIKNSRKYNKILNSASKTNRKKTNFGIKKPKLLSNENLNPDLNIDLLQNSSIHYRSKFYGNKNENIFPTKNSSFDGKNENIKHNSKIYFSQSVYDLKNNIKKNKKLTKNKTMIKFGDNNKSISSKNSSTIFINNKNEILLASLNIKRPFINRSK